MPSKIEWTDETWNPVRGCSRVSPGCDNCYAMRNARRMDHPGDHYDGLTKYSTTMGRDCDLNPVGIDHTKHQGVDWSGKVRLVDDRLDKPLHWRKPRHVFVNSMGDLFHEKLTNEQIAAVFGVMAACQQHTFQVLTKRPERMVEWFAWLAEQQAMRQDFECQQHAWAYLGDSFPLHRNTGAIKRRPWPLPNVWLGVSAEDQQRADARIPSLLQVPAAVRFVSCEPLLEQVVLRPGEWIPPLGGGPKCNIFRPWEEPTPSLDWVIVGCESGYGARPADTNWFRVLREQCQEAGVPFFLKQMKVPGYPGTSEGKLVKMPKLDGRVWDETPNRAER